MSIWQGIGQRHDTVEKKASVEIHDSAASRSGAPGKRTPASARLMALCMACSTANTRSVWSATCEAPQTCIQYLQHNALHLFRLGVHNHVVGHQFQKRARQPC
jgi:hypothetical protein